MQQTLLHAPHNPSNMEVCMLRTLDGNTSCASGNLGVPGLLNETMGGFAFPRGVRYVRFRGRPNAELGQSYRRLPVTHTHTLQHAWQVGMWFYYMRGCSDFSWDVGRTLLARNRCELAVTLEQRAAGNATQACAIQRIVRKLQHAANLSNAAIPVVYGHDTLSRSLATIIGTPGNLWPDEYVAAALNDCAHGLIRNVARNATDGTRVCSSMRPIH